MLKQSISESSRLFARWHSLNFKMVALSVTTAVSYSPYNSFVLCTHRNPVPDAPLTALGRQQSAELYESTKGTIQMTADLLVSSALRRPLSTMIIGYADLIKKLEAEGKKVIVLPQLQEVFESVCRRNSATLTGDQCNDLPCDTGSVRIISFHR